MNHKTVLVRVFNDNLKFSHYKINRLVDYSVLSDLTLDIKGGVDMSFTHDVWVLVREEFRNG